jgi:hypothetical protein
VQVSRIFAAASFVTSFVPCILADTLEVPGDFPRIQEAIGASVSGDIIVVAPGTYAENLNFLGKNITIMSSHGPTMTTVQSVAGPVVTFTSGEGRSTRLSGLTLRGGNGGSGPCFSAGVVSVSRALRPPSTGISSWTTLPASAPVSPSASAPP